MYVQTNEGVDILTAVFQVPTPIIQIQMSYESHDADAGFAALNTVGL